MTKPNAAIRISPVADTVARHVDVSTRRLFSTTFGVKAELRKSEDVGTEPIVGDVSGMVSLHENQNEGHMMVVFPKETIFSLLEKIYGQRFTELNKSVKDAVGEVTNVLFGMIKKNLNEEGFHFRMALPSVIVMGANHEVWPDPQDPAQVLSFSTPVGSFSVSILLRPSR